jgi:(2R)-3-sulfolactate dehydrogenase (NADP+)
LIVVAASSGGEFAGRVARLIEAISAQPGAHVPGAKRKDERVRAASGIGVSADLLAQIQALAAQR